VSKEERLLRKLGKLNPDLSYAEGKRHWKIKMGPHLVGILPYGFAMEGMNRDLECQLRRHGVRLPEERKKGNEKQQ
jgi:hypothetical protein